MNEIILNSVLITYSICIVWIFLITVKKLYGLKSSISAYAKPLQQDGRQIFFYIFIILGICFPLTYIGRDSYILIASSLLLSGIGCITGYNPGLREGKLQHTIHVILTNLAIWGFLIGIVVMNIWFLIPVGIVGLISGYMLLKKIPRHTYKIEVLIIHLVWFCLIVEKILIPLLTDKT